MRLAVIDCGTNTFNLLIADKVGEKYSTVYQAEKWVRLGEAGSHYISANALRRAVDALKSYINNCNDFKVDQIYAFGTSALRTAYNSAQSLDFLKRETGLELKIISGEDEATYIFKGIVQQLPQNVTGSFMVMDIGGGSTEFIIGNRIGIQWKVSMPIGALVLKKRFQSMEQLSDKECIALSNYLEMELVEVETEAKKFNISLLIGTSGSFDTLRDVILDRYKIEEQLFTTLDLSLVHPLLDEFKRLPIERIITIPGVKSLRADLMAVASVLIQNVLQRLEVKQLISTSLALKEGIMISLNHVSN